MGRHKKHHEPINDTFENVINNVLKVPVENKRVKKDKDKEKNKKLGKK